MLLVDGRKGCTSTATAPQAVLLTESAGFVVVVVVAVSAEFALKNGSCGLVS